MRARRAPRLRAAVVFSSLWLLGGCAHAAPPAACPAGLRPEPARLARVQRLLAGDAEAAALLRAPPPAVCFGDGVGDGVLAAAVARLDAGAADAVLAPRLAHLLVHHRDGLGDGCAAGLSAALRSEAEATVLEARLRRALGQPPLPPGPDARADYLRRCAGR